LKRPPVSQEALLSARESRGLELARYKQEHGVLMTLQANTPGWQKRHPSAYYLLARYEPLVEGFAMRQIASMDDDMGPACIYQSNQTAAELKQKTMRLENTPLGRLIDIDVHDSNSDRPLSRGSSRMCLICDQPAAVCRRENRHSIDELLETINQTIRKQDLVMLTRLLDKALSMELDLDPKFGLVTPKTSGSHPDMTIELMRRSKNAIVPFLAELFFLPLWNDSIPELFTQARSIGLIAEQAMYRATKDINTHKGMIFNLGLAVLVAGYAIANGIPFSEYFNLVREFALPLAAEVGNSEDTVGQQSVKQYPMMGARVEAIRGFPAVEHALQFVKHQQPIEIFVDLVRRVEDTVLFKRSGSIDKYREVKTWFDQLDTSDPMAVRQLSERCVKEKLSFGGAADLFVVTTFLSLLQAQFRFTNHNK
jgi:holo-ACP synthase / triphosphoribosyl-dephospho-CoA synthase